MSDEAKIVDGRMYRYIDVNQSVIREEDNGITKASEIAVYCAIAMYADNRTRQAYPNISTIANKARVSERTVRTSVKQLEKSGYIRISKKKNPKGQPKNVYTLLDR